MELNITFESLPENIQQKIIDKVSGLIARASVNRALLSKEDIMILTGKSKTQVERMMQDPRFPAPVELIKNGHKTWQTVAVLNFFDLKRRSW